MDRDYNRAALRELVTYVRLYDSYEYTQTLKDISGDLRALRIVYRTEEGALVPHDIPKDELGVYLLALAGDLHKTEKIPTKEFLRLVDVSKYGDN